jgi:hypothetical protein
LGSKIVAPLIKGKKYRTLLTNFTDELRLSKNFRERQIYIEVALSTYLTDNEIFKKHFAKNIATDLENEKCKCVQISLAKLCNEVPNGTVTEIFVPLITPEADGVRIPKAVISHALLFGAEPTVKVTEYVLVVVPSSAVIT